MEINYMHNFDFWEDPDNNNGISAILIIYFFVNREIDGVGYRNDARESFCGKNIMGVSFSTVTIENKTSNVGYSHNDSVAKSDTKDVITLRMKTGELFEFEGERAGELAHKLTQYLTVRETGISIEDHISDEEADEDDGDDEEEEEENNDEDESNLLYQDEHALADAQADEAEEYENSLSEPEHNREFELESELV